MVMSSKLLYQLISIKPCKQSPKVVGIDLRALTVGMLMKIINKARPLSLGPNNNMADIEISKDRKAKVMRSLNKCTMSSWLEVFTMHLMSIICSKPRTLQI